MKSFSIFNFHNFDNLAIFIETLPASIAISRDLVGLENESLQSGIRNIDGFNYNEHENIQVENEHIQYIFFEGFTERARKPEYWYIENDRLKDREERINPIQTNFVVFSHDNNIFAIVFAGINRGKALIKDIFPAETWGNVEPVIPHLNEDLLYWIFKRHIDLPDESLSREHQVFVTALESYMGKTRDNVNALRGEGSRISTILGTLAFLFNNENLKAVRPQIQYGNESVLIELSLTGTFKFWVNAYRGIWTRNLTGDRKQNAVAIYIFVKIIPLLIECYNENLRNNEWSPQLKVDFLRRLGTMIRDRVNTELARIEGHTLKQLNAAEDAFDDIIPEEEDELEIDDPEEEDI
ncbi:hypothetical protein ACIQD3_09375 [Peribacillus loiseleuriae]|uniref:hypothetical protein n=1 Tax=Peribacillus loiseleuriae TaxID=1679170 RepID=UPI0037F77B6C